MPASWRGAWRLRKDRGHLSGPDCKTRIHRQRAPPREESHEDPHRHHGPEPRSEQAIAPAALAEEWRLNNFLPENRPESAQIRQFADEVNAALANKDFKLTLYSGGSLGIPNHDLLRALLKAVFHSTLLFSAIGFVVLGAIILAQSVAILGVPQQILRVVADSGLDRYSILALVALIYLILGRFFDGLSMMIKTLPVVFPLLTGLGYDAIWVGVIITIVIEIDRVTPPVGLNLSVLSSLTNNEVSLGRVAKATVPYWIIHLLAIVLLTFYPAIALYLPEMLF